MHTFKVAKLVRDDHPELMKAEGFIVHTRIMEDEEYLCSLREKIVEEAQEVNDAQNHEELLEELADLFEVIDAFLKAQNISTQDIDSQRLKKKAIKGGFTKKIYSEKVQIEKGHPMAEYFLNRPNKYPLMRE